MPDPIRMLHTADLHIGMENYGRLDPATGIHSRVIDFLRRFDETIDYALEHEADVFLFAGDAFKTRDPNPTYQREFARRIKRLSDAGVPTLLLVGNHDLPAMEKKANSMDIFRTLEVPNVTVGWRDEVHVIQTRRGPLQIACLPYPMRQRLLAREENRGKNLEELDRALSDIVGDMVRAMAAQLDPDIPAVLTGHLTVAGATFGSERSVMIGSDVVAPKSLLADPAFDYVALGHIHKHQELEKGSYPAMVYAGSLERIDLGEERDPKGFCWVELVRHATRWQFVPVHSRRFLTIWADVREAEDVTQAVLDKIAEANVAETVVRVNIKLKASQETQLRERDVVLALKDAYYVTAVSKEVEREVRARLGSALPEALSPRDLLTRYFESKGTDPAHIQKLIECAGSITTD